MDDFRHALIFYVEGEGGHQVFVSCLSSVTELYMTPTDHFPLSNEYGSFYIDHTCKNYTLVSLATSIKKL